LSCIACCCSRSFLAIFSAQCIPNKVFHPASSPGGGKRRKLACSIGSPYSRQALGKSTAEPTFIFNPASRVERAAICRQSVDAAAVYSSDGTGTLESQLSLRVEDELALPLIDRAGDL
jgi:hypothetical protein